MTKLRKLGNPTEGRKTRFQMQLQRLAMLGMSRKVVEAPIIVMPNGKPAKDAETNAAIYYGIALGITWAMGEENLPMQKWSVPR